MKKICLSLFGILACNGLLHADAYCELDEELITEKDFPFPPGQEGTLLQEKFDPDSGISNGPFNSCPAQDEMGDDFFPESKESGVENNQHIESSEKK